MSGSKPAPPPAPGMRRHIRLYPHQWVGIPILALLPVLAVLGVFGQTGDARTSTGPVLEIRAEYPSRMRYKTLGDIAVRVGNRSGTPLDSVIVNLEESHLAGFSNVTFTPQANEAHRVTLGRLDPGEEGSVAVEVTAERYGRWTGAIVAAAGSDTAAVEVSTLVFP